MVRWGALSWVPKPTSALLLALLESLGGDLGPFTELLWTLLSPEHTHCPPSCVSEVTDHVRVRERARKKQDVERGVMITQPQL